MFTLLSRRSLKCFQLTALNSRTFTESFSKSRGNVYAVENLTQRGLLKVQGVDVHNFLQGLITNDIRHLESMNSIYTLFLNVKGRVMCDTIIYKTREENVLLIECDSSYIHLLQKHLKLYRVRRKIDIDVADDKLKVWVFYRPIDELDFSQGKVSYAKDIVSPETLGLYSHRDDVIICRDPRVAALGYRVVAPVDEIVHDTFARELGGSSLYDGFLNYRVHRYVLGIGEGICDLPPGVSFPLEANSDYLHGVSFHKGCYIGQELTARTHHTGVVRKRLMPVFFRSKPEIEIPSDAPIQLLDSSKKSVGKLRAVEGKVGLGLLRVTEAIAAKNITVMGIIGETCKPQWWPQEAPKDRLAVSREA
ncbi:putative transferase CAF17 homolog, mitochondrial [Schistocerca cancellata]|uniref:putative transferase CAF17 homolog, mitochondrial n=1 Tax=Schistocerca cancellata TaxID=274614 RepID=UPI0021191A37|nr:putative transferase CAF17 homolog, mitochondrial [Schistocerca cancellata]